MGADSGAQMLKTHPKPITEQTEGQDSCPLKDVCRGPAHMSVPERPAGSLVINPYLSTAVKDILRNVNNFINFKASNLGREI